MPPCRKICTGRWMPMPLPACPAAPMCPAVPTCPEAPTCPAVPTCPAAPACPVPPLPPLPPLMLTLACSCDEPELTCDEDTCANAADCKQLHPAFCPHGLATDDDCINCCEPPLNPEMSHLVCPHCQSQIALFDDLKKPQPPKSYPVVPMNQSQARNPRPAQKQSINTRSASTATANIDESCLPSCPSKKSVELKSQSCNPMAPCCESDPKLQPKRRSPHISQIKVSTGDDLESPNPPPEPENANCCCKSANAIQSAPRKTKTPASKTITSANIGPTCCSEMGGNEPPDTKGQIKKGALMKMCQPDPLQCKECMQPMPTAPAKCCPTSTAGQAGQNSQTQTHRGSQPNQQSQNAAKPARGSSSKGKEEQKSLPGGPNPDCPRVGAAPLFPAKPAPQACLCRMPPAYTTTGCTGNLSGNCNCTDCNK